MKFKFLLLSVILFGLIACNNDDDNGVTTCDMATLISPEDFINAPSVGLHINTLEINGDCLKTTLALAAVMGILGNLNS